MVILMNKKIIVLGILIIIWMGFIFLMSSMDATSSDNKSKSIAVVIIDKIDQITKANEKIIQKHQSQEFIANINHLFRKFSHAFVYLILALLTISFLITLNKYSLNICIIITMLFSFFYACTDEFHQTFVNGRTGLFSDVLIDSLGAFIGCILFTLIYKLIKFKKNL